MTDMLERYLQAIGQYLPDASRADTLAELRANLWEQIDARAEGRGRAVEEADVAAVLREHGKPEAVALRYLPQESLIGPTIFPFYKLTLVRVLPLVVFVSFIAKGVQFVSARHESFSHAIGGFAVGLASSVLVSAAIITIVFAAIERGVKHGDLGAKLSAWDPEKLPAVKKQEEAADTPKSVAKKVLNLVLHCLWFAYVLWVPWHPFWIMGPGVFYMDGLGVGLAPVWHTFYALLIVLLSVQLVMHLLAFVPSARAAVKPLDLVSDLLGVVAIGLLALASVYFVPVSASADVHQIATVNHSVGLALRIAFVFSLAGFVKKAWPYVKRRVPTERLAF